MVVVRLIPVRKTPICFLCLRFVLYHLSGIIRAISQVYRTNSHLLISSPSFGGSDEQLTQHPSLVILVISDCVVELMTNCDLQGKGSTMMLQAV